ncbi:MAG: VOC family protein [Rhizobiaceae bacterium]|nr:VOC family protein [Rhizobiaceae bacterium]
MIEKLVLSCVFGLSLSTAINAEPMPGMRGVDHIGLTVPDLVEAETFFTDVLGCKTATSFGPFRDDEGTFMQDLVDVDPRAVIEKITLVRCGFGSNIELFKYTAPDQKVVRPRNSDIGGHHIGIYVEDIAAAAEYFKKNSIKTKMGPVPITEGPVAGQSILYFFAPWGLQMEAISYPKGMAYEKSATTVLWSPRNPSN